MIKRFGLCLALSMISVISLSYPGFCESEITKQFLEAYDQKNAIKMSEVIKANKDKVPDEIRAMVEEALKPETKQEDRDSKFFVADMMARAYKDETGDVETLKFVKRKEFDSKLGAQVRSTPQNGVHIVEFPMATPEVKNIFRPDNIIIKAGETVRWVNKDEQGHIFASMPLIGVGGIFTPRIEPGKSWEFKFEKPGEYYYICFIHHGMIGKITVE
ncbi:MAG: cupredoxin domain-containing protein [Deltaproteobacteria bacterium]|nr:cupredoxin domain-containing protein [Deltaproteobacteria bacterium]